MGVLVHPLHHRLKGIVARQHTALVTLEDEALIRLYLVAKLKFIEWDSLLIVVELSLIHI